MLIEKEIPTDWSKQTQPQQEKFLQELMDPRGTVKLTCRKHFYAAGSKLPPVSGCRDCWMVSFIWTLANIPPDKRQERLEELEAAIHHMVEVEEAGRLDFKLYRHPKIDIEKGD